MKALFAIAALAIMPTFAHAKITVFSTSDAVRKVMNSDQLSALEQKYGPLSKIEVKERDDSNALQAFELHVTITNSTPIGLRSCFTEMHVFVTRDEAAPHGIAASKMLDPVVQQTLCQK